MPCEAMKNLFTIMIAVAMLASCAETEQRSILPEGCELRTGDVVFRRGSGLTSRAVLAADRHGAYSHIGIVVDSCGVMMVVHAVPGEPDYEGDPDRVKMDTPQRFFSSMNARIGEVKRLRGDSATALRAARFAVDVYKRGTLFDHDYDDTDTTKMYCCELIDFVYRKAGRPLAGQKRHYFHLPGLNPIRCILPSDICNSGELDTVMSF